MSSNKRNGATISGTISLAIIFLTFILGIFFSLPSNVLNMRDGNTARVVSLKFFPQSWDFFTKSQQDPELIAYQKVEEEIFRIDRFPNSKQSNFYGFSRE